MKIISEKTFKKLYHSLDYYIRCIWNPLISDNRLVRISLIPDSKYARRLRILMKINSSLAICYIIALRYPSLRIYTRNIWVTVCEKNPMRRANQIYNAMKEAEVI